MKKSCGDPLNIAKDVRLVFTTITVLFVGGFFVS
jgi:hypothetical protein